MIVGSGVELCSVPRFRASLDRFGERLLERVFSPAERAYAERRSDGAENLAVRFAAKAAARTALRRVLDSAVPFRDLEIARAESGEPSLIVHGQTLERLAGQDLHIVLSMTHDADLGLATVLIERTS